MKDISEKEKRWAKLHQKEISLYEKQDELSYADRRLEELIAEYNHAGSQLLRQCEEASIYFTGSRYAQYIFDEQEVIRDEFFRLSDNLEERHQENKRYIRKIEDDIDQISWEKRKLSLEE